MKIWMIVGICCLLQAAMLCRGQTSCLTSVPSSVEADNADLSLADVLGPSACPSIVEAASAVRLGKMPLAGSVRIFEGGQIRALLESLLRKAVAGPTKDVVLRVPDRISVRRRSGMSCAEIAQMIFSDPRGGVECGSQGRISRDAGFEVARSVLDPATRSWGIVVRCTRPGDCVPFLVRVPEANHMPAAAPLLRSWQAVNESRRNPRSTRSAKEDVLVHAGETAMLVWDQDGIRAVVRAVCLDHGREGQVVRARVVHTGRMLRAIVVAPGQLRAQS